MICHEYFIPRQTFETLFTPERLCQICRLDLKRPLLENHIPYQGNTLVVLTFEAQMKPAYFHTLMQKVVEKDYTVLFFEDGFLREDAPLRLLGALLHPLMLFHSEFLTLEKLETIEAMLEGK